MAKIDLKKELKQLYNPNARDIVVVDVPAMNFLMVDGEGDPNTSQQYRDAVQSLYTWSYTLKFMIKKGKSGEDYGVMPLEGLWWGDDMNVFVEGKKDRWKWTAMIMQPRYVTRALFEKADEELQKKKKELPALDRVRLESFCEGRSAQIMYLGPYAAEGPTIQRIHAFIKEQGGRLTGKHHEIYLGDPRRTAPEKLKTVIRQPFEISHVM
jgi:hypothetical protein